MNKFEIQNVESMNIKLREKIKIGVVDLNSKESFKINTDIY